MQARVATRVEAESIKITLRQLREELNFSQTALASAIGISKLTVNRIEQPDNNTRLSTLQRYVKALVGDLNCCLAGILTLSLASLTGVLAVAGESGLRKCL